MLYGILFIIFGIILVIDSKAAAGLYIDWYERKYINNPYIFFKINRVPTLLFTRIITIIIGISFLIFGILFILIESRMG